MDAPLSKIAKRLNVPSEQVLLAWAKAKGVVVVTYVLIISHHYDLFTNVRTVPVPRRSDWRATSTQEI